MQHLHVPKRHGFLCILLQLKTRRLHWFLPKKVYNFCKTICDIGSVGSCVLTDIDSFHAILPCRLDTLAAPERLRCHRLRHREAAKYSNIFMVLHWNFITLLAVLRSNVIRLFENFEIFKFNRKSKSLN